MEQAILLSGGFALSSYLFERVQEWCPQHIRLLERGSSDRYVMLSSSRLQVSLGSKAMPTLAGRQRLVEP